MSVALTSLRGFLGRYAPVPPHPGQRLAACGLIALLLVVASPAAADPVKADVSVNMTGGYARIVFRLSEDIDADVRAAGGILVISFKQPVEVAVDRISAN